MLETSLKYIMENGDLKVILLAAVIIAYRQFGKIEKSLNGITAALNSFRTKEECDYRHEGCIKRIETLEKDMKELNRK